MCYLCDEYGDGGIWYLNPKNYARNMYKTRLPGEGFKGPEAGLESGGHRDWARTKLLAAAEVGGETLDRFAKEHNEQSKRSGGGSQVLPLRDAEKVLELCSPISLIACACRKRIRGIDERNELEYTCMGMGVGMLKWERWPERYKGGVRFVNVEEAKEWTRKMDKKGFVHLLMLFGAPYIGGFCQCDYLDCEAIRNSVDFGMGLLKSHYVASVDYDKCNGCGICAQRCQFGALKFEVTTGKANIDPFQCYGCGLCETACPREAIELIERKSAPELAEVWWGVAMNMPRKFPRITIDREKCTVPFLCKKCVQVCPVAAFGVVRIMEKEERLKEVDPRIDGNYELFIPQIHKCTGCNKCVDICPVDAIKIEVGSLENLG